MNRGIKLTLSVIFSLALPVLTLSTAYALGEVPQQKTLEEFCDTVNQKFREFQWDMIICNPDRWDVYGYTVNGNPLLYQVFGSDSAGPDIPVNLVLCGVHGDEPSAIYQCFHLVRDILYDNPVAAAGFKLVVAPMVNPDGFFLNTRQNAVGVDPNRNLPTRDWFSRSQKVWARFGNDPRKYPGENPGSEAESMFQAYLINKYQPDKILSFHAPLGFLDFDGPGDRKYYNLIRVEQRARDVGLRLERDTNKFLKFVDYSFFPGSLGNYAGNERKIPAYTVELPSAHAAKSRDYWMIIRSALIKALGYHVYDEEKRNPVLAVRHTAAQNPRAEAKQFEIMKNPLTSITDKTVAPDHES